MVKLYYLLDSALPSLKQMTSRLAENQLDHQTERVTMIKDLALLTTVINYVLQRLVLWSLQFNHHERPV